MAQSALDCGNAALRKLGSYTVTAVDGSDTSKAGLALYAHLDPCKKALLRRSPWNFAIKRKIITPPASFAISNVTWVSSQVVEVTHASVTYALGSYVTITGVSGATLANGTFEVSTATVGGVTTRITVPLATTSALLGTYVASTGDEIRQSPAYDYSYLYTLPSDCLKFISCNDEYTSDRWLREGGYILSNEDTSLKLKYVYDVTDYTLMDVEFYECLSTFVAWTIIDHLSRSDQKKRALYQELNGGDGMVGMLPKARFDDAIEDSMPSVESNDWLLARGAGTNYTGPVNATETAL